MEGDKVLYDRNWRAPDTVSEVIEAVHNLIVAIYMIRNYSYEVRLCDIAGSTFNFCFLRLLRCRELSMTSGIFSGSWMERDSR